MRAFHLFHLITEIRVRVVRAHDVQVVKLISSFSQLTITSWFNICLRNRVFKLLLIEKIKHGLKPEHLNESWLIKS
jgi:hypothetical protein